MGKNKSQGRGPEENVRGRDNNAERLAAHCRASVVRASTTDRDSKDSIGSVMAGIKAKREARFNRG